MSGPTARGSWTVEAKVGQSLGTWGEPTSTSGQSWRQKWSCCWGGRECRCHRGDEAPHSGPHLREWAGRAGSREAPGDIEDSRFLGAGRPPSRTTIGFTAEIV